MDGIQAAVLRVKLRHLEKGNELRRSHAAKYDEALSDIEELDHALHSRIRAVTSITSTRSVFPERRGHRNRLRNGCRMRHSLSSARSTCRKPIKSLGYEIGAFPIAERAAHQFISLPMFPELTSQQIELVTAALKHAAMLGVLSGTSTAPSLDHLPLSFYQ